MLCNCAVATVEWAPNVGVLSNADRKLLAIWMPREAAAPGSESLRKYRTSSTVFHVMKKDSLTVARAPSYMLRVR